MKTLCIPDAKDELLRAKEDILKSVSGISAVFWGKPSRNNKWSDEEALCVYVEKKHSKANLRTEEIIPKAIRGISTDVIEIGQPTAHFLLSTADPVKTLDPVQRKSTISAIVKTPDDQVWMLLCAHGTMPVNNDKLICSGSWSEDNPAARVVDQTGREFIIELLSGSLDHDSDYSLASLDGVADENIQFGNTFASAPLVCRTASLSPGDAVYYFSMMSQQIVKGEIAHLSFQDATNASMAIHVPHLGNHNYANIITVASANGIAFSQPGDSGALVFDKNNHAIGTVIGGTQDENLSFILALRNNLSGAVDDNTFTTLFNMEDTE